MKNKKGWLKIGFLAVIFSLAMLLLAGECMAGSVGGGSVGGGSTSPGSQTDPGTQNDKTSGNSVDPVPGVPGIDPQPQPQPQGGDIGGVAARVGTGITSLQIETATRAADVANKIPDAAQFVQDKELISGVNIHFQDHFVAPIPLPGDGHER